MQVRETTKTTEGRNQEGTMKFKAPNVPKSAKTPDYLLVFTKYAFYCVIVMAQIMVCLTAL